MTENKICLVIPCYNEASRLPGEKYLNFVQQDPQIELLFVNDGSSDQTLTVLGKLKDQHHSIHILDLKQNGGKAEAVRQGMLSLKDRRDLSYAAFWDADLATPLEEVANFLPLLGKNYDSLIGSRILRLGGDIRRSWHRHILGRVFATVASISLKLPIYDTQCGAKFYKASLLGDLFKEAFISHWLFDVELFFRLKRIQDPRKVEERIYELPLTHWQDVHGSRLKITDFLKAPYELWQIVRHYGH